MAAPVRSGGTMSSAEFWQLVDRLQIPDPDALELIGYAGKIGKAGKRPRFRLSSRQTHLAAYLPKIEAAQIKLMVERDGEGMAEVLQFLNRAALRRSLRWLCRQVHSHLNPMLCLSASSTD